MKHIHQISASRRPATAMDAGTIITIIGTVFSGVGGLLLAIGPFLSKSQ